MVPKKGMGHKERETPVEPLARPPLQFFWEAPAPHFQPVSLYTYPEVTQGHSNCSQPNRCPRAYGLGPTVMMGRAPQPTLKLRPPKCGPSLLRPVPKASRPAGKILPLLQTHSKVSRNPLLKEALQPRELNVTVPAARNPSSTLPDPRAKGINSAPKLVG